MYGTILRRINEINLPDKAVILTFDDGPETNGLTAELLDLLRELRLIAAFCIVGNRVHEAKSIVARMHADGHLIVNHGAQHKLPNTMSDTQWRADYEDCDRAIRSALGEEDWHSEWYRPPGGGWNGRIARLMEEKKKKLMPITFFGWDTIRFPYRKEIILSAMLRNIRKAQSGVFVLHEAVLPIFGGTYKNSKKNDRQWILEVVREFVTTTRKEGFSFEDPRILGGITS